MFTQKDNLDQLEVKADTGADITIHFDGGSVDVIEMEGHEFDPIDDVCKDLIVKIGGKFYTFLQLSQKAIADYDDICKETLTDMANEEAMNEELSSPFLSGRI